MRTLKISLLVFILSITISAQEGWFWQNPIPPGNSLLSVEFINTTIGFAVGDESMILKTTDGGNTWIMKDVGQYSYLVDVEFINENTGWVLDFYYGNIFKTIDSGESWSLVADLEDYTYWDMYFINNSVGWLSGQGYIYKTTNGGSNWTYQFSNSDYSISSLFFLNEQSGWAIAH